MFFLFFLGYVRGQEVAPRRDTDTVSTVSVSSPRERKPFYMAVKTNLLYDAVVVPNLGLEFYLGRGWSIAGNWMYTWLKNDNRYRYHRVYGGDLEVRRWLSYGRKPLTGHHMGIYGLLLLFLCLVAGIVKLQQVEGAGTFLLGLLPLTFLPGSAGLLYLWEELRDMLVPLLAISVISTVVVMAVTGRAVQGLARRKGGEGQPR